MIYRLCHTIPFNHSPSCSPLLLSSTSNTPHLPTLPPPPQSSRIRTKGERGHSKSIGLASYFIPLTPLFLFSPPLASFGSFSVPSLSSQLRPLPPLTYRSFFDQVDIEGEEHNSLPQVIMAQDIQSCL